MHCAGFYEQSKDGNKRNKTSLFRQCCLCVLLHSSHQSVKLEMDKHSQQKRRDWITIATVNNKSFQIIAIQLLTVIPYCLHCAESQKTERGQSTKAIVQGVVVVVSRFISATHQWHF